MTINTKGLIKILKEKPNVDLNCIICDKAGKIIVMDMGPMDPLDMAKLLELFPREERTENKT